MTTAANVDLSVDLAVVGAGPKGAAIAAKTHVLNSLGIADLKIAVIERRELASSWTGRNGFTSGMEELGTRPEKDVGFPYQSLLYDARSKEVDAAMMQFSWQTYLIETGEYRRWIDSGLPHPSHREFAEYLAWVFARTVRGVTMCKAETYRATLEHDGWSLQCNRPAGNGMEIFSRRGIVMTGTGAAREIPCAPEVRERVITPAMHRTRISALNLGSNPKICIVGVGESAASMAIQFIETFGPGVSLTFVAPTLPYSRAESFLENTVYSAAHLSQWEKLPESARHHLISRTDRGVISLAALGRLTRHKNLSFVLGQVKYLKRSMTGKVNVVVDQSDEIIRADFDAVANCIGFCPLAPLLTLLGDQRKIIEKMLNFSITDAGTVSRQLDASFALRGLEPKIHIPALAGLLYGPGFGNLSCLGTMSDRILSAYIPGGSLPTDIQTNRTPAQAAGACFPVTI